MFYQKILNETSPYVVSTSKGNGRFPLHRHYEIEMHYCKSGTMTLTVGEKEYSICDGTLAVIGSMMPHSLISKSENTESVLIEIGPIFLKEMFGYFSSIDLSNPIIPLCDNNETQKLIPLLDQLFENSGRNDPQSKLSNIGCLWNICHIVSKVKGSESRFNILKRDRKIERILDYIHIHYTEQLKLDDIVSLMGYSKGNICKSFKEAVGTSFHTYLNNYRIHSSLYLLKNTDMPIGEIAENVGFTELKSFCRVFKSVIGITPGEFRK